MYSHDFYTALNFFKIYKMTFNNSTTFARVVLTGLWLPNFRFWWSGQTARWEHCETSVRPRKICDHTCYQFQARPQRHHYTDDEIQIPIKWTNYLFIFFSAGDIPVGEWERFSTPLCLDCSMNPCKVWEGWCVFAWTSGLRAFIH